MGYSKSYTSQMRYMQPHTRQFEEGRRLFKGKLLRLMKDRRFGQMIGGIQEKR